MSTASYVVSLYLAKESRGREESDKNNQKKYAVRVKESIYGTFWKTEEKEADVKSQLLQLNDFHVNLHQRKSCYRLFFSFRSSLFVQNMKERKHYLTK